jgi:hypothetical protein
MVIDLLTVKTEFATIVSNKNLWLALTIAIIAIVHFGELTREDSSS